MAFYRRYGKRAADLAVAVPLLIILLPVLAAVAVAVAVRMGRPVLFRQVRAGLGGQAFCMLKFRSMTFDCDSEGRLLPDRQRLTGLGSFLRRTSLDELPQLWNVLKGDMSLVGPRPLFEEYLPYYTKREQLRHTVKPGITGLAQVNGRNLLGWDEMLELDAIYAERCSITTDLSVLLRTFWCVASRRDVAVVPGDLSGRLDMERGQAPHGT